MILSPLFEVLECWDTSPKVCGLRLENSTHKRTLAAVCTDPVSGNIEWRRVEALFKAAGCEIIEGSGSRITIVHKGRKAAFHRPHPGKDTLRYQIRAARDFLRLIGVTP